MRFAALSLLFTLACGQRTALDFPNAPAGSDGGVRPGPAPGPRPGPADVTCRAFAGCGGNAVGNWTVRGTCAGAGDFPGCAGGKVDVSQVRVEGVMALRADATFSSTTSTRGTIALILPKSCLPMGLPVGCLQVGALLTLTAAMQPMSPVTVISCREAGTACDCKAELRAMPQTETGIWRVDGTTLVTKATGAAEQRQPFCIEGNVMRMNIGSAAGMGGLGTGELTLVLQR